MPISASAKKSLRVSRNKKAHNHELRIALKRAIKEVNEKNISDVISTIDKAVKAKIIHFNKAGRLKSALSKKFKDIKFPPPRQQNLNQSQRLVPNPKTKPKKRQQKQRPKNLQQKNLYLEKTNKWDW